jgi:hypothetical protein
MTPQKGGSSEYKSKEEHEFKQVWSIDDVHPFKIYYIRPTDAPRFYQTEFSSKQHINQIEELLNAGKIWQRV